MTKIKKHGPIRRPRRLQHVICVAILLFLGLTVGLLRGAHQQAVTEPLVLSAMGESIKATHTGTSSDKAKKDAANINLAAEAIVLPTSNPDQSAAANIWEQPSNLPSWLKEYFSWHHQQTSILEKEWKPRLTHMSATEAATYLWNQPNQPGHPEHDKLKFMLIRCFSFDRKCGGLADRLLPLPYLLQIAHNSSRILLVHFQKPALLEEYLAPPRGGIDWRIPSWLLPAFNFTEDSRRYKVMKLLEYHANNPDETVVQSIFQAYHYGSQPYEERRAPNEPTFRQVTRSIWRVMFTPVAPIQRLIKHELNSLGIREGNFAAIHCRVLYAVQNRDPAEIRVMTENALHCASELYGSRGPFFVASDSPQSTTLAIDYGRQLASNATSPYQRPVVVTRSTHKIPIHFDRIPVSSDNIHKGAAYQASDYYDTYIDLLLMSMAECVTHGVGGFGKLASFLSYNETCSSHHFKKRMRVCSWHTDSSDHPEKWHKQQGKKPLLLSLLAPPME